MSTYTDGVIVYDPTTGFTKKIKSADTLVITNLTVGTDTGGLTIDTAAGAATLSVSSAGLTRADDITIDTGSDSLITTGNIQVTNGLNPLVISDGGLARTNQEITLDAGTADVVISGNARIEGNLDVSGTITGHTTQQVSLGDAFIELLASNTNASTSPKMGGLTVNMSKAAAATEFTILSYTASTIVTSTPSGFSSGDIILVANESSTLANNGLYVVDSVATTTITIKAVLAAYTPFCQTALTAGTAAGTARCYRVNLAVLAVSDGNLTGTLGTVTQGNWAYKYAANATESAFGSGWSDLSPSSLQRAYGLGNSITMTNGSNLTVTYPTTPGESAAISLKANADSEFEVTGTNVDLTLKNTGDNGKLYVTASGVSGDVEVSSAGDTTVTAGGDVSISTTNFGGINIGTTTNSGSLYIGSGLGSRIIEIGNTNTTTGVNIKAGTGNINYSGYEIYSTSYGAGYAITLEPSVVKGDLVYITASGTADRADKSVLSPINAVEVSGVAIATDKIHTVRGRIVLVGFTTPPTSGDVGNYVYLDTVGKATVSTPTSGATRQVGRLWDETAVDGLYPVLFNPAEGITLNVDPFAP